MQSIGPDEKDSFFSDRYILITNGYPDSRMKGELETAEVMGFVFGQCQVYREIGLKIKRGRNGKHTVYMTIPKNARFRGWKSTMGGGK